MIKLQIQSDTKDSVLDIIWDAISAEIKRLEIDCKMEIREGLI